MKRHANFKANEQKNTILPNESQQNRTAKENETRYVKSKQKRIL